MSPRKFLHNFRNFIFTQTIIKIAFVCKIMKTRALINFAVPPEKKAEYKEACDALGLSMTEICVKALDQAILLSKKVKP